MVPSRSDALPLILLQGMAAGLPVVASAVGGIPEAVSDGGEGQLVRPDDPAALAAAINRILADPAAARACGAEARLRVEREFSLAKMIRGYLECYSLLEK